MKKRTIMIIIVSIAVLSGLSFAMRHSQYETEAGAVESVYKTDSPLAKTRVDEAKKTEDAMWLR